jgi:hypothetical protein
MYLYVSYLEHYNLVKHYNLAIKVDIVRLCKTMTLISLRSFKISIMSDIFYSLITSVEILV